MRLISRNIFALILSAAFVMPAAFVSVPVRADVDVDVRFWGTQKDYNTWCAENYPSCVSWDQLPGTWRTRYRTWWEGRYPDQRWGVERKHHKHEHETEIEIEHEHD